MLTKKFGESKNGEAVSLYIFRNQNGMEMRVSDFGATLQALLVPDKHGRSRDVVLGYDDPQGYEGPSGTFFGAVVGRNANRIGGASFVLNGKTYELVKNNGNNNLHSGPDSWSFRVWDVKAKTDNSITFAIHSPNGDQGYPGTVDAQVTYTLTDDNSLVIQYEATADADTLINLTNHSYFNLNGHESGSVREHMVWMDADRFTPTDETLIPTGEMVSVDGTPMDFRVKKTVGQDIDAEYEPLKIGRGYDHNWILNNHGQYGKAAELSAKESGIAMEVYTDRPGLQIYTANYVENEVGKNGIVYNLNQGICFETQNYPDAIHHDNFPSPVCKKGELFKTTTAFRFVSK